MSAPRLVWQACLKKTGVKSELLTNNDVLIIVEKRIGGGICHAIRRYAKANNKYMKNYNKNIESSYLMYLDETICMDGQFFKNYLQMVSNGKKIVSKFDEELTKNYDEDINKGYILEVVVEYPKDLHKSHSDLLFLSKRMSIEK